MGAWEDGYAAGYSNGKADGILDSRAHIPPRAPARGQRRTAPKRQATKRKLTAHNRFMKKEMRSLRRKHPRMKQTQIMKKANAAWRKKKRGKK